MLTLVTGAAGRLGSRFVPRLLQQGDTPRALVRDSSQTAYLEGLGVEVVVGDLRDAGIRARAVEGVDAVVHIGAVVRGDYVEDEMRDVNHAATVELARAAADAGAKRFVFVSTNLVYGKTYGRPAREDDETGTDDSAYADAKLAAERELLELKASRALGVRIVRFACLYGDGCPHLGETLEWAEHWAAHRRLHLVHYVDASQALVRILHAEGIDGRVYNAADDAPMTSVELYELNDKTIPPGNVDIELPDPWERIIDTSRIRTELGFRPIYPTAYTARDAGAL